MSDQSQGPGWWQASDGKWYPPEQAPGVQPPTTAPIGGPPTQPPATPPGGPSIPPGGPAPYAAPAAGAAAGGSNTGKIVAVVVALALIGGGVAFALTRGGGGGGSTKAFCDNARKFQNDESLNKAFNDPSKIDKAIEAFDELTKSAPKEIKPDMETLRDAVNKIGQAVKSAGSDPSKQFGAVIAAAAGLDQKKLDQAGSNVEKFGKENCGVDFSLSSSSSSEPFTLDSSSFSFDSSSFSFDTDSFDSELSSFSSILGSDFFSSFSSELNNSESSSSSRSSS